ncbi:hypothetical protein MMC28_000773 [Mycoblastus sanguinarius]|nr:hypothetical protein [Mycoblastus sanguinarius]
MDKDDVGVAEDEMEKEEDRADVEEDGEEEEEVENVDREELVDRGGVATVEEVVEGKGEVGGVDTADNDVVEDIDEPLPELPLLELDWVLPEAESAELGVAVLKVDDVTELVVPLEPAVSEENVLECEFDDIAELNMLVVALEDTEDIVTELDDGFVGTATDDDEDANPVMSLDVEEIGVVGLSVLITKFELDDEVLE